jgi:lactoylglutathione lyase
MVELDDEYDGEQEESIRIKTCLRMNVADVKAITNKLIAKEVEVDYQEHTWGIVAKFFDSDGNLCAFKDSGKFEQQVERYLGD